MLTYFMLGRFNKTYIFRYYSVFVCTIYTCNRAKSNNSLQAKLPLFNGRVVSWLVAAEGSVVSQSSSHHLQHDLAHSELMGGLPPGLQREAGVGETRPPSFQ